MWHVVRSTPKYNRSLAIFILILHGNIKTYLGNDVASMYSSSSRFNKISAAILTS
jgi:hypothetical protein